MSENEEVNLALIEKNTELFIELKNCKDKVKTAVDALEWIHNFISDPIVKDMASVTISKLKG